MRLAGAGRTADDSPVMLLAPPVEEFIKARAGFAGYRVSDAEGRFLAGDAWISMVVPTTREPEFHSMEENGVTYRVVVQRVKTAAGELILQLADGSDARQQWVRSVFFKVLLPNLILVLAAALWIWKKNFLQMLLGSQLTLPEGVWARLTVAWVAYFLFMAGINAWVAAFYSTEDWVNFKLWGYVFPVVFIIGQGLYIARYLKSDTEAGTGS